MNPPGRPLTGHGFESRKFRYEIQDLMLQSKLGFVLVTSRNLAFGVSPRNATFQTQVIHLGLKTGAIFKGNFSLDYL
jgi:hypothetical protein